MPLLLPIPAVRDRDIIEMNLARLRSLKVVAHLEITLRVIQLVRRQRLEAPIINLHRQLPLLIPNLVRKRRIQRHVSNLGGHLVATRPRLLHAHEQVPIILVVQLADRPDGHGLLDVDLPDARLPSGTHHGERRVEPVDGVGGGPVRGAVLAELGAAVLAVGGCHTLTGGGRPGDFHDEGGVGDVVVGFGVEVLAIVATAALERGGGDRVGAACFAGGEFELEMGEVEDSSWGAGGVRGRGGWECSEPQC